MCTRLLVGALFVSLVAVAVVSEATAQSGAEATVEVRVWQAVSDERDIRISARPAGGSWRTLGTFRLPLDDGTSSTGRFRYGDIAIDVPLPNRAAPATVEVRVWQDVANTQRIYISARPAGGDWGALGTIPFPLTGGLSSNGQFRYGDIALDVPLPETGVRTLAGRPGLWGYVDARGEDVRFGGRYTPLGLAVDRDGSVIVADPGSHAIRRITPDGVVTTIAGGDGRGLRDGPSGEAQFDKPRDVALAADGAIYVADFGNHRIRKITPGGMVTTVAGSDYAEEDPWTIRDGRAEQALFREPSALALRPDGDLYIVDAYHLRRLSPSGWVSTVAGGRGFGHTDGPVEEALFHRLVDIGVDDAGNVYLIDTGGSGDTFSSIRKIDTAAIVTTLYWEEQHPALGGTLAFPEGLAVTGDGTIYLANTGRHQILRLTADNELQAVAGTGEKGLSDGPRSAATFSVPGRMAVAPDGSLFVVDQGSSVIREILPLERGLAVEAIPLAGHEPLPRVAGVSSTVFAGEGKQGLVDGRGRSARFTLPVGLALDRSGNLIVADSANGAIRSISPDGTVTTIAGNGERRYRDGACDEARFEGPRWVAVHADGSIYVTDSSRIRRIERGLPGECAVTTVAGKEDGSTGRRDGPAAEAEFTFPAGIAFDSQGNLFIAGTSNRLIRRLSPDGQVTTVAGGGARFGGATYEGLSTSIDLHPVGLAVDDEGNVFFTDTYANTSHTIRKLDRRGYVSTALSTPNADEGGALSPFMAGLAVGPEGELYISNGYGRLLRFTRDGILAVVVDTGAGDGVVVTPDGTIFVADESVIRKITIDGE